MILNESRQKLQAADDSFGDEDYYDGCGDSEHCNDEITVRRAKFLKAMRDKFVDGLERSGAEFLSPRWKTAENQYGQWKAIRNKYGNEMTIMARDESRSSQSDVKGDIPPDSMCSGTLTTPSWTRTPTWTTWSRWAATRRSSAMKFCQILFQEKYFDTE